jgi:AraC-like DNA-binding protein
MKIVREEVQHPEGSVRCMDLSLERFQGGLHRHRHLELTWIRRGQGLRWVGDSVEPFLDGDLVLVGSDVPHQWVSHGPSVPGEAQALVLQFPADLALRTGFPELAGMTGLQARAGAGLQVDGVAAEAVKPALQALTRRDGAHRLAAFVELLAVLLDHAGAMQPLSRGATRPRSASRTASGEGRTRQARIDRVLAWVEDHLADELRVEAAAAVAHLSPTAFSRFFQREVGKRFTAYVNDARCGWAALRLLQSDEPVSQVAQACGFPTLSNFGEQFRRRYGVSPRSFRQASTRAHSDGQSPSPLAAFR